MSELKVRVFKGGESEPATTVTIPAGVLKIAHKFIPDRAITALKEQGIDIDELVRLSESPGTLGKLAEIEDHKKNERVIISLE